MHRWDLLGARLKCMHKLRGRPAPSKHWLVGLLDLRCWELFGFGCWELHELRAGHLPAKLSSIKLLKLCDWFVRIIRCDWVHELFIRDLPAKYRVVELCTVHCRVVLIGNRCCVIVKLHKLRVRLLLWRWVERLYGLLSGAVPKPPWGVKLQHLCRGYILGSWGQRVLELRRWHVRGELWGVVVRELRPGNVFGGRGEQLYELLIRHVSSDFNVIELCCVRRGYLCRHDRIDVVELLELRCRAVLGIGGECLLYLLVGLLSS